MGSIFRGYTPNCEFQYASLANVALSAINLTEVVKVNIRSDYPFRRLYHIELWNSGADNKIYGAIVFKLKTTEVMRVPFRYAQVAASGEVNFVLGNSFQSGTNSNPVVDCLSFKSNTQQLLLPPFYINVVADSATMQLSQLTGASTDWTFFMGIYSENGRV